MARSLKRRIVDVTDALGLTRQIVKSKLEDFVRRQATEGLTLDLGCGRSPYADAFPNRVATDAAPGEGVDVVADAHDLSAFDAGRFDCVLCTEVLEHLHDPQTALDEIYRVLRSGGKLILSTRFVFPLHDTPHDYYRFTRYGLTHLLRRFEILECTEETRTLEAVGVLYQRIGLQCETLWFLPLNVVWFVAARLCQAMSFVITRQVGRVAGSEEVGNILTSGYHVVCRKP